jgi:long-chain acyl-CoA synthetase
VTPGPATLPAAAPAGSAVPFPWGRTVVDGAYEGHPGRLWEPRRHLVPELLLDAARWSDREFLVQGSRRIRFDDHARAASTIAARLRRLGAGPATRVMIAAGNHPETIAAWWGVLAAGATVVMANAWWSDSELAAAVEDIAPVVLIADKACAGRAPDGITLLRLESLDDAFGVGEAWRAGPGPRGPVTRPSDPVGNEDDPAVILFTSGTTGAPKGVVLSHRAVIANVHTLLAAGRRLPQELPDDAPAEVHLFAVPFFHLSGFQTMVLAALTGGRLVFPSPGRFDAGLVLGLVDTERITSIGAVPTMLSRIADHPDLTRRDVSSVRTVTTGGMSVAPAVLDRVRAAFPSARRGVGAIYGLTESGGALTGIAGSRLEARPWSSGRPLPVVELRIADPDDDGVGEVTARSPMVMSGYWNRAGEAAVDADGWLRTGDLGRIEDGELLLLGRSKDVIIRAGENVAAAHVESCLLGHPAVEQVAVVGLADPELGEEVGAVVVRRAGHDLTQGELERFAAADLAHFEVPTAWWLRSDPLPETASGKVEKSRLVSDWQGSRKRTL